MNTERLIGIDIGTTSVKATLFDVTGQVLVSTSTPYPIHRYAGARVEQNPKDWMTAVLSALQDFEGQCTAGSVRAIGITSQVNTHVFTGADGQPLAPAWVWQDGRAAQCAAALDSSIDEAQRMQWWGAPLPVDASHIVSRMQYMASDDPDCWEKTRHVLLPKDYCLQQLTGSVLSDPLSNVGAVNMQGQYVTSLLEKVPGAAARLPPLADMCTMAGTILPGLPFSGVPVAVGTMDAWAGVFGTGTIDDGSGMYLSGTSEVLGILSPQLNPTPGVLLMPRVHDFSLHIGPTQSGGASQLWFCELMGITPEQMSELASRHPAGKPYPLFLPHLQGERAPLWDASSRGVFLGLDASTDQSALALAVYDGVGCSARWLLESLQSSAGMTMSQLNAGGGGFRSDFWNQLRSDILGVDLDRVSADDPGTLGAAGLAAVATGLFASPKAAFRNLVKTQRRYSPDESQQGLHEERMDLYKKSYNNTKELSPYWV